MFHLLPYWELALGQALYTHKQLILIMPISPGTHWVTISAQSLNLSTVSLVYGRQRLGICLLASVKICLMHSLPPWLDLKNFILSQFIKMYISL